MSLSPWFVWNSYCTPGINLRPGPAPVLVVPGVELNPATIIYTRGLGKNSKEIAEAVMVYPLTAHGKTCHLVTASIEPVNGILVLWQLDLKPPTHNHGVRFSTTGPAVLLAHGNHLVKSDGEYSHFALCIVRENGIIRAEFCIDYFDHALLTRNQDGVPEVEFGYTHAGYTAGLRTETPL